VIANIKNSNTNINLIQPKPIVKSNNSNVIGSSKNKNNIDVKLAVKNVNNNQGSKLILGKNFQEPKK